MTATALQIPAPRLQPATVPPGPTCPSRPQLRLLEGGRAPSRLAQRAIYRRRRLVAALLAVVVVVALVLLATAAVARLAGGAPSAAGGLPSTSAAASSAAGVAAPTVVVQPGDDAEHALLLVAEGGEQVRRVERGCCGHVWLRPSRGAGRRCVLTRDVGAAGASSTRTGRLPCRA